MVVGGKGGLERVADFVDVAFEAVLDVAVVGVDQTDDGTVGRDQDVPTVRTELQPRPIAVNLTIQSAKMRHLGSENNDDEDYDDNDNDNDVRSRKQTRLNTARILEGRKRSLVESSEVVEFDCVGLHADAEDESLGVEGGHRSRREIHQALAVVATQIPQAQRPIQRTGNEEIVGRRHAQAGHLLRMPGKVPREGEGM